MKPYHAVITQPFHNPDSAIEADFMESLSFHWILLTCKFTNRRADFYLDFASNFSLSQVRSFKLEIR